VKKLLLKGTTYYLYVHRSASDISLWSKITDFFSTVIFPSVGFFCSLPQLAWD
jgi:hypothetical protein